MSRKWIKEKLKLCDGATDWSRTLKALEIAVEALNNIAVNRWQGHEEKAMEEIKKILGET